MTAPDRESRTVTPKPRPPTDYSKRSQRHRQEQRLVQEPQAISPENLPSPPPIVAIPSSVPRSAGGGKLWGTVAGIDDDSLLGLEQFEESNHDADSQVQCRGKCGDIAMVSDGEMRGNRRLSVNIDLSSHAPSDRVHDSQQLSFDDSMVFSLADFDFSEQRPEDDLPITTPRFAEDARVNDLTIRGVNTATLRSTVQPVRISAQKESVDVIVDKGMVVRLDSTTSQDATGRQAPKILSQQPECRPPVVSRMRVMQPALPEEATLQRTTRTAITGPRPRSIPQKPMTAIPGPRSNNDVAAAFLGGSYFPVESLIKSAAPPTRQQSAPAEKRRRNPRTPIDKRNEDGDGDLVIRGNMKRDTETAPPLLSRVSRAEKVVVQKPVPSSQDTPTAHVSVVTLNCDAADPAPGLVVPSPPRKISPKKNKQLRSDVVRPVVLRPVDRRSTSERWTPFFSQYGNDHNFADDFNATETPSTVPPGSPVISPHPSHHLSPEEEEWPQRLDTGRIPSPDMSTANSDNWTAVDISPVPAATPPAPSLHRKRRAFRTRQSLAISNAHCELKTNTDQEKQNLNMFRSLPKR